MDFNIGTTMRQYLEAKAGLPENPIVIFCEGEMCAIRFGDVPLARGILRLVPILEGVHEGVEVRSIKFPISEYNWAIAEIKAEGEQYLGWVSPG